MSVLVVPAYDAGSVSGPLILGHSLLGARETT